MDLTIRSAAPEEYALLGEITAQAYLGDGLLSLGEDDPYLARLRDVAGRAAGAEVLVVVDDTGTVLGGVAYAPPGSPLCDVAAPDEAEFRMLAVDRAGRGRGAGEALVRACAARARATAGVTGLVLSTQPAMTGAHRIYRRLGFARTPERDWSPVPGLTLLTYRLDLGAAG
ncbi:GNAT family N-acetyltransferase [Streptomyces sp. NBC_01218]|uniref:GNAT family N-acetyltransferase n=1 Tax=unclassified Streptomyces TaxID=2593676 RepID=UPI0023B9E924|nr:MULTISPECIES: GNAT family N-acetyltransferase [unclassified Streptomyces]WEH39753.1 GNAT family N-acetyltransferase [Streptomyces sp. AM 2-1-1]WSQ51442.1 GNAT family N-acetyltransferase [Streptomyces sp. NBC_01218]